MARACCIYHRKRRAIILLYEGEVQEDSVKGELKNRVPIYMVPETVVRLDAMPMNANGKIDRTLLKEKYGE